MLFSGHSTQDHQPLAERLRPKTLDDIAGQDHILGADKPLRKLIEADTIPSMILWGPPGCGKTTLARVMVANSTTYFEAVSAIFTGVADLKKIFVQAQVRHQDGLKTILFVDEIHRFNKAQQDAFLPHMESGVMTLIGATTENPSFALNPALLSRAQLFTLRRLTHEALSDLFDHAMKALQAPFTLDDDALIALLTMADGDGRALLGMIDHLHLTVTSAQTLTRDRLSDILQKRAAIYDSGEDHHYNLISALHKAVRGSDVDAALYWFSRMLEGGEDPKYLARRITRMAVEDIGLAAPQGLQICLSAWEAYERLGSPEGELALAQAVIYLATAPKSNAAYTAYKQSRKFAAQNGSLMPPKHILNAPTKMMKDEGYGDGYQYDHDVAGGFSGQNYFPDTLQRPNFYTPKGDGFEKDIKARLAHWDDLRHKKVQ